MHERPCFLSQTAEKARLTFERCPNFGEKLLTTYIIYTLNELAGQVELHDFPGKAINGCLNADAPGLICDFSNDTICGYFGTEDNHWFTVTGQADHEIWKKSVNADVTPTPPSSAVQLLAEAPIGVVESDYISCLKNEGTIMFSFWATDNANLAVCLVTKISEREICSESYNQSSTSYPGPFSFVVKRSINEPFKIQYVASLNTGVGQGFVFLDELGFFGRNCENSTCSSLPAITVSVASTFMSIEPVKTSTEFTTVTTTPTTMILNATIKTDNNNATATISTKIPEIVLSAEKCGISLCDFEKNMCDYSNSKLATVEWMRRNTKLGHPLTRINDIRLNNKTGFYLATMLTTNDKDIAILQSSVFDQAKARKLKITYFRAIYGTVLALCQEKIDQAGQRQPMYLTALQMKKCPVISKELSGANALVWNTIDVELDRQTYMV
uniref:MAM domain-containing protein n=1 Tax=Romanomermis culicivorax TaxID=13658 RepID=A0A915L960_ROMCU